MKRLTAESRLTARGQTTVPAEVRSILVLLGRIKIGRSEKSMLLTGLRGVGKTVLLNEIERLADAEGYRTISVEAHEDKQLGPLLAPYLRRLLFDLDRVAGAGDKVKRGLAVLRSFIGSIKLTIGDVHIGLDIEPEKGAADSGDLETDLPNLFVAVAEAAAERSSAVALLIDEIQYFNQKELGALIMAMHKVQQRQLPMVLVGAGLPILPGLAGESKSYAERLFGFPDISALSEADAAKALQDPARDAGVNLQGRCAARNIPPDQGIPLLPARVGLSGTESCTVQPDHAGPREYRDRYRHWPARREFLSGALRAADTKREEPPACDGGTGSGPPSYRRYYGNPGGQGKQSRAGTREADQEGNDLQPRARRYGIHCPAVRRIHDPRDPEVQSLTTFGSPRTFANRCSSMKNPFAAHPGASSGFPAAPKSARKRNAG
jgi:bifunctional DNA-binding transcriptional regulator/antitoxin component of YhaV-PrlF toxin-antitoxin module